MTKPIADDARAVIAALLRAVGRRRCECFVDKRGRVVRCDRCDAMMRAAEILAPRLEEALAPCPDGGDAVQAEQAAGEAP